MRATLRLRGAKSASHAATYLPLRPTKLCRYPSEQKRASGLLLALPGRTHRRCLPPTRSRSHSVSRTCLAEAQLAAPSTPGRVTPWRLAPPSRLDDFTTTRLSTSARSTARRHIVSLSRVAINQQQRTCSPTFVDNSATRVSAILAVASLFAAVLCPNTATTQRDAHGRQKDTDRERRGRALRSIKAIGGGRAF